MQTSGLILQGILAPNRSTGTVSPSLANGFEKINKLLDKEKQVKFTERFKTLDTGVNGLTPTNLSIFEKLIGLPAEGANGQNTRLHPAFAKQQKHVTDFFNEFVVNVKGVPEEKLVIIDHALEKIEPLRRLGFFQQGVARILWTKPIMEADKLQAKLDFVIQKLDEGLRFLPIEVLDGMTFEKSTSCSSTKMLFINSFENKTLIRTTAKIGEVEKTIFIKGVWDDGGNFPYSTAALAYEPAANAIYELSVKDGKPELGHPYHFGRIELHELLIPFA